MVEKLIVMGADIHIKDKNDKSAVDLAAEKGNQEIIAMFQNTVSCNRVHECTSSPTARTFRDTDYQPPVNPSTDLQIPRIPRPKPAQAPTLASHHRPSVYHPNPRYTLRPQDSVIARCKMAEDKATREIEDTREAIATVKVKVKKENQAAAVAAHEAAKAAEAEHALAAAAALAEDEECTSPKSVLSSNR